MELDFSQEAQNEVMRRYDPLLCPGCRAKLRARCLPILARMNEGKKPRMTDMVRLIDSLCMQCLSAIKKEGSR